MLVKVEVVVVLKKVKISIRSQQIGGGRDNVTLPILTSPDLCCYGSWIFTLVETSPGFSSHPAALTTWLDF